MQPFLFSARPAETRRHLCAGIRNPVPQILYCVVNRHNQKHAFSDKHAVCVPLIPRRSSVVLVQNIKKTLCLYEYGIPPLACLISKQISLRTGHFFFFDIFVHFIVLPVTLFQTVLLLLSIPLRRLSSSFLLGLMRQRLHPLFFSAYQSEAK